MIRFRSWAAALAVAVVAAGCGGGGSSASSSPPIVVTVSPKTVALAGTTTGPAPSASVSLSATNMPDAGLYVRVRGTKGYVTATFDGQGVTVNGVAPGSLAVGTYRDSVAIDVCYDAQCARPISGSPLALPVTYTVTLGDPATSVPMITQLSPASVVVGSQGFVLVLSGNNFAPTSSVAWNGQVRATTYVSANTLNAQINASDVASIGTASVTVSNASTGGGVSLGQSLAVTAVVPVVTTVSPASAATGGSAYTLTVNGTGFDSLAQVTWNGSPRTTSYVSPTQVTAQITAADIASAGNFPVGVYNADNGAMASNTVLVSVADAPLALVTLSPPFVVAGGPAYMQTVIGTGFNATSTLRWNGSPRVTTLVSTTQLRAQVSAADIASVGTATLTVVNGGSTPGTSAGQALTIGLPSTEAVAFQVNPQHNGAIRFATVVAPSALPTSPTWTAALDGTASYPLIAGGRVFVTVARSGGGSEIVALSAASGELVWGPVALAGTANATYDNGRVIVLSGGFGPGILTAFDAATGSQLWSTALTSQYSFSAPPTAANGMVYTGGAGSGGTLYAVNDATGALVWSATVWNGDASSPTITADGVYVTYPCQTYDFGPLTGALLWHNDSGCEGGGGATGTFGGGVYYSPNQPAGYSGMSFDAETGAFLSAYTASQPPALGAAIGYFLQAGTLSAIGLSDNVIRWTFAGDGTLATAPILVNGYVFVGGSSGRLYALDATTGATLWQTSLAGATNASPWMQLGQSGMAAGNGMLVVPVGSTLAAFTLSNNP